MSVLTWVSGLKRCSPYVRPCVSQLPGSESAARIRAVPVRGCLHLKSAATQVAADTILCNPRWVDPAVFAPQHVLEVDGAEPYAANGLLIDTQVLYPTTFPATRRRLEERRIAVTLVDVSELQKAEGAVTCCSLVFRVAQHEGKEPG